MSIGITDANTADQVIKVMLTTGSPIQQLEAFCKLDEKLLGAMKNLAVLINQANRSPVMSTDEHRKLVGAKHVIAASMQGVLSMMGVIDSVAQTKAILSDEIILAFVQKRAEQMLVKTQPIEGAIVPGVYYTRTGRAFRVLMTAMDGHNCKTKTVVYVNLEPTDDFPAGQVWTIDEVTFRDRFNKGPVANA